MPKARVYDDNEKLIFEIVIDKIDINRGAIESYNDGIKSIFSPDSRVDVSIEGFYILDVNGDHVPFHKNINNLECDLDR
jgi:hypothetical protein